MKRALIIVDKVAPLGVGNGKEHLNSTLIKTHVALGYQVNVIVIKQKAIEVAKVIREMGGGVITKSDKNSRFKLPWKLKLSAFTFRRTKEKDEAISWLNSAHNDATEKGQYEMVITSLLDSDMPAWVAASLKALNSVNRYVIWEHRSHYATANSNFVAEKVVFCRRKWIFTYSDKIAVVSNPTAKLLIDKLGDFSSKIITIPNPVKEDFFSVADKKINDFNDNRKYCIATQNFVRPIKGFDVLLKAIHIIHSSRSDIMFLLVGKHYSDISEKLEKFGLTKIVTTKERVPHEKIVGLLSNARVTVISSYVETFSVPAAEALASGVPVVSTICGGPEDFVRDKIDGRLVPTGNPESLADAIIEVWDSADKYDPVKLSNYAKNLFGMEAWAVYWEKCHNNI